jgi:hypothetical protein
MFAALATAAAMVVAVPAGSAQAACDKWSVVPTRDIGEPGGDFDNGLSSMAVVSPTDLWAVGNHTTGGGARSTLAEHWNGNRWRIVATPDGPNEVNWLIGADAVASDDVWAVGYSATNPPEQSQRVTLVEHWDGRQWSVVPSPNPEPPLSGGTVQRAVRRGRGRGQRRVGGRSVGRLRRGTDVDRPLERSPLVDGSRATPGLAKRAAQRDRGRRE